jgi:hypothetical protein
MQFVSGHIKNLDIFVAKDTVTVINETTVVTKERVPGLSRFISQAAGLTLGFAKFADFAVIYLYDKADDCFGYAVNLADPTLNEWGYAPLPDNEPEPEKIKKKGGET